MKDKLHFKDVILAINAFQLPPPPPPLGLLSTGPLYTAVQRGFFANCRDVYWQSPKVVNIKLSHKT